jgi:dTDP-4-dehydrorhamnose 3,5-epimerase
MKFIETKLKGAYIIEIEPFEDERGFFARTFCRKEFEAHGLNPNLVQCNISYNRKKGTLRGMHYQAPPYEEAKLVICISGAIYDVIIDFRPNSPTYCQWIGVVLSGQYTVNNEQSAVSSFKLTDDSSRLTPDAAYSSQLTVSYKMLYIPEGFAHGFLTLMDNTEVFYQMSEFYMPEYARGVRWNDPAFGIHWPRDVIVISEKDKAYHDFTK